MASLVFDSTAFDAPRRAAVPSVVRDAGRGRYASTATDETERYQVELVDGPGDELDFVRAVRTIARLSLAEALDIHAYARRARRTTIVAGIPFAAASQVACSLETVGIAVLVGPSVLATPMLCRPRADEVRDWTFTTTTGRPRPAA